MKRWLSAALVCACSLGFSTEAQAYHSKEERITDRTAYTMPKQHFRIGVFRMDYSIWDSFTAKTYIWPWLFRVPNVMLKWRLYGKDPWAFAIDTGVYAFDSSSLEGIDGEAGGARVVSLPFEALGTYRFNERHNLSASLLYTAVFVEGELSDDAFNGALEGAVENAQLSGTYQWTLSRVTALQFTGRMVLLQRFQAAGDVTFMPDEYTTVELIGGAQVNQTDIAGAGAIQADVVLSWKRTNLRLGLGYGHYNIPGINFVLPAPTVYPAFDLHWIFD